MTKRIPFDTLKAIQFAWDELWKANLKRRGENEKYFKKTGKHNFDEAGTYYLCAADLVRAVRCFAQQSMDGKPWSVKDVHYYGYGVRVHGNLQSAVRRWLQHNPRLIGHNFGRGHISGARYRPVGEPMAEAELQTIVKKERSKDRPKPRHYGSYGYPLCTAARRNGFSRGNRYTWCTKDQAEVTCPRCIKLLNTVVIAKEKESVD